MDAQNQKVDTTKALNWRYATKQYDTAKKLSPAQLAVITEALRLAPSSFGFEAWKFIHVTDKATREKLKAAAWGQPQLTDASDIFILASRKSIDAQYVADFVARTAKARGIPVEALAQYKDMMTGSVTGRTPADLECWLSRQVYIPLGVAVTAAAVNGIDTSPMEGFDPKQFSDILGLEKEGLVPRTILAAGFRSADDKQAPTVAAKVRFSKEEVFIER